MLNWMARMCMAGIFLLGGYEALLEPGPRTKRLPNVGMQESETLVVLNGAAMMAGGAAMAIGFFPRLAAFGLLAALIPTTLAGHAFWKETEVGPMKMQRLQFAKNLGLIGGLLLVLTQPNQSNDQDKLL